VLGTRARQTPALRKTVRKLQAIEEFERKNIMTCKIERLVVGEDLVILCISGQITGQDVDLLRALLEQETRAPVLDLKDLVLVDREAVQLLASRESNGTELRNCPAYVREWVKRERAATSASEQGIEVREQTEDV
jgi:transketolase C-terminal domain/subunit